MPSGIVNRFRRRSPNLNRTTLNAIAEAINGGRPNWYLYTNRANKNNFFSNANLQRWIRSGMLEKRKTKKKNTKSPNYNGSGNYRWSKNALLIFLEKKYPDEFGRKLGYGIVRKSSLKPYRLSRRNVMENISLLF